jgi:hypothetical protein
MTISIHFSGCFNKSVAIMMMRISKRLNFTIVQFGRSCTVLALFNLQVALLHLTWVPPFAVRAYCMMITPKKPSIARITNFANALYDWYKCDKCDRWCAPFELCYARNKIRVSRHCNRRSSGEPLLKSKLHRKSMLTHNLLVLLCHYHGLSSRNCKLQENAKTCPDWRDITMA